MTTSMHDRGIAADLAATAADIAADVRVTGSACPASLEYARDLIGILDDTTGPARPVPFSLTPKAEAALAFPPVVCLCGSTRFVAEFNRQRKALTERGQIVLAIEVVTTQAREHDPQHADPALKARLDELHKRKIDLADYVLVLNVGGYVGESTRSEIAYAHAARKPVRYLEPEAADEWACEMCGDAFFGARPDDGRCPDCRDAA